MGPYCEITDRAHHEYLHEKFQRMEWRHEQEHAEVERLRADNAILKDEIADLRGDGFPEPAEEKE